MQFRVLLQEIRRGQHRMIVAHAIKIARGYSTEVRGVNVSTTADACRRHSP